ncbi:queuosine-tRNA galactosyltransferase isoform X2 [Manis javanica]|uniref:queuosine-tRNA galactosyltransferase isoform X2 n=1 Tax=Manis javanica TaxID=9974 RepID=UPI003C6CF882
MPARGDPARVSIILPVHNAEPWLDECLRSVLQQDFEGSMELSVFNDASKDKSMTIVEKWKEKLEGSGILVVIGGHDSPSPRGVGYSKNQAVAQSSGPYLCFLDSIIGCRVSREPPGSTERYTRWVNQLEPHQLLAQVFTSNGPTVIMPTWFCSRAWFSHVGPFDEGGRGVPEDLLFFYNHLRKGGGVIRVDQSLLLYRYHPHAATHAVLEYETFGCPKGRKAATSPSGPGPSPWAFCPPSPERPELLSDSPARWCLSCVNVLPEPPPPLACLAADAWRSWRGPRRRMLLPAFLPSLQRVAVLHPCQPPNCLPPGVGCRPPPETPQCSFGKPVRCLLPRPRTPLPRSRPGGLVLPGDFVAHSSHEALPEPHPAPGTQARKHWLCCPKPASPPSRLRPAGPGTPALRQRGRIWPVPRGRCRELPPWPHAACPRGSGWGVLMALCGVHTSGWRELGTTEKRQSQDRSDPV